jgi:hypothetical protein
MLRRHRRHTLLAFFFIGARPACSAICKPPAAGGGGRVLGNGLTLRLPPRLFFFCFLALFAKDFHK